MQSTFRFYPEGWDVCNRKAMQRIKSDFQKKDIQGIRIFNPSQPHKMMEELILDFYKEVSYNRGASANKEVTRDCGEDVLGQTVRLKNLEKRPELNGRCGVCVGYDSGTDRYLARIITEGVEQDISLRQSSFSILKPKLTGQTVLVKGLQSKPELNGRYGFVDEFLRESERYRILLPDRPGVGLVLALKSENLEKVTSFAGAVPIKIQAPATKAEAVKPPVPKTKAKPASSANANSKSSTGFGPPDRAAHEKPQESSLLGEADDEDPLADIFGPRLEESTKREGSDLMTRIFAAECDNDSSTGLGGSDSTNSVVAAAHVAAQPSAPACVAIERPSPCQRLQLSLNGLLGMRVWAVVADPDEAEEILDHLMDCGKTVFSISAGGNAHFASTAELGRDPGLPKAEVLAFIDPQLSDVRAGALDAKRLGVQGILLHPEGAAYGNDAVEACRDAGMTVHSADILSEVQPGLGLPVAPLD
jgi:hypothetical protein